MHQFHRLARSAARVAIALALAAPAMARQQADEQAQQSTAPVASPTFAPAKMAHCGMPIWPKSSLRAGDQGAVTLAVLVGVDGKVVRTTVVKSSGFAALDAATIKMLPRCTFMPAVKSGVPEQGWTEFSVKWR
ncbi:MAG: energy transducer TonB [Bdellovibrionales bacterium]|nr:energy transducer TonB [Massilia sp.]